MKKIILDTDLGGDCDDAGAISLLLNLEKQGLCKTLGITHCIANHYGAYCIDAILQHYGRKDIPIGYNLENNKMAEIGYQHFTAPVAEKYFPDKNYPVYESSLRLMRRLLAENNGINDIVLVTIGPLMNILELFNSKGDDISSKSGMELLKENVFEIYCMGGNFINCDIVEWNIKMDIPAARAMAELSPVPITYCGFELGEYIITGKSLEFRADPNPVKDCYHFFNQCKSYGRASWDLITVYNAVINNNKFWAKNENLDIKFNEQGVNIIKEAGKDAYMTQIADNSIIESMLEALI